MRVTIALALTSLAVAPIQLDAQNPSSSQSASARTSQLVAMFTKHKHVVKDKRGVREEKYKDVRTIPATRDNPSSYSGDYDGGLGFALHLTVKSDGSVAGSGEEPYGDDPRISLPFVIENGKIDGALLTGTMVYRDGSRARLEGVFMNRISRTSPNDPGTTTFGIGVLTRPKQVSGLYIERLFFERSN
jgi:hypothetical protein